MVAAHPKRPTGAGTANCSRRLISMLPVMPTPYKVADPPARSASSPIPPFSPFPTTPTIPSTTSTAMFAQYSPLFTSGLLSDSSPSSSRSPSPKGRVGRPERSKKTTHDSLPVTVNSASFSLYAGVHEKSSEDVDNALFLTFKPSRQQVEQGRSFLSLDLAESHRSMSLRRKDTMTTTHGRSVPTSPVSSVPSLP